MNYNLNFDTYRDKVRGCWIGKIIGGTLGAPVEGHKRELDLAGFMQEDPRGVPNDDLDLQLIWLCLLEERGCRVRAGDFVEWWLNCIPYDPDEYGVAKSNMRKGLRPPLTGSYNNWFKDCMGSPIRSEIWACLAPASPQTAARLAYEDAVVDHAGGESVYGEMFLSALQSAAFVESDPQRLIEIGLSVVPAGSRTAGVIRDTVAWVGEGLPVREVRRRILEHYGDHNSQKWLQNAGFIILGWLSSPSDYGQAMLNAINCGYDTDCTGATVGAILGILIGYDNTPARWRDAVGDKIAAGVVNLNAPADVTEMTDRICALAEECLITHGSPIRLSADAATLPPLYEESSDAINALLALDPAQTRERLGPLEVAVDYGGTPTIGAGKPRHLTITLASHSDNRLQVSARIIGPCGWQISGQQAADLPERGAEATVAFDLLAETPAVINSANSLTLILDIKNRPSEALSLSLVGESRWLMAGPFPNNGGEGLDTVYGPETDQDRAAVFSGQGSAELGYVLESDPVQRFPVENYLVRGKPGVVYALSWFWSDIAREAVVGVPCSDGVKAWLNDVEILRDTEKVPARPYVWHYGVFTDIAGEYAVANLQPGWNKVLLKFASDGRPLEAHFLLGNGGKQITRLLVEVTNQCLPWEKAGLE